MWRGEAGWEKEVLAVILFEHQPRVLCYFAIAASTNSHEGAATILTPLVRSITTTGYATGEQLHLSEKSSGFCAELDNDPFGSWRTPSLEYGQRGVKFPVRGMEAMVGTSVGSGAHRS